MPKTTSSPGPGSDPDPAVLIGRARAEEMGAQPAEVLTGLLQALQRAVASARDRAETALARDLSAARRAVRAELDRRTAEPAAPAAKPSATKAAAVSKDRPVGRRSGVARGDGVGSDKAGVQGGAKPRSERQRESAAAAADQPGPANSRRRKADAAGAPRPGDSPDTAPRPGTGAGLRCAIRGAAAGGRGRGRASAALTPPAGAPAAPSPAAPRPVGARSAVGGLASEDKAARKARKAAEKVEAKARKAAEKAERKRVRQAEKAERKAAEKAERKAAKAAQRKADAADG